MKVSGNLSQVPYEAEVNGARVAGEMPAEDAERITEGLSAKGGTVKAGIYEFAASCFEPEKPSKARQKAVEEA